MPRPWRPPWPPGPPCPPCPPGAPWGGASFWAKSDPVEVERIRPQTANREAREERFMAIVVDFGDTGHGL